MARLSKTNRFTIYEDTGIPTPDPTYQPTFDDAVKALYTSRTTDVTLEQEQAGVIAHAHDTQQTGTIEEEDLEAHDADDERRESSLTAASVSSFPDSICPPDQDETKSSQAPYTPPVIRPSFRRPASVQRMRLSSPHSFDNRSPRESILRHSRSRHGTPKSVNATGSPRSRGRRRGHGDTDEEPLDAPKHYPLVLLHVSLLPVDLPWSTESTEAILPPTILDNLQLLRSKVSETMLKRGILIPHPKAEYELLEERLLEALELKEQRVTKCGHFHGRDSVNSVSEDSDSGVGSSLDGSDGEKCTTCQHHIKTSRSGVGSGSKKWTIKVFAANGLMRSSAWAAAWSEMESVDVEILPWISDAMRQKLDERRDHEDAEEREREEEDAERMREIVDEQVGLTYEERDISSQTDVRDFAPQLTISKWSPEAAVADDGAPLVRHDHTLRWTRDPLPQIYSPSQIPLRILLRNYVYLQAQDRRNVIIFFLSVLALFFAIRTPQPAYSAGMTIPYQTQTTPPTTAIDNPFGTVGQNAVVEEKAPARMISAVDEDAVMDDEFRVPPAIVEDSHVEPENDLKQAPDDTRSLTPEDEPSFVQVISEMLNDEEVETLE